MGQRFIPLRANQITHSIKLIECSWMNNRARYGSAIDILPHSWDTLTDSYLPLVQFVHSKFLCNTNMDDLHDKSGTDRQGVGSLMCTAFSFYFEGLVVFHNNTGTALYITSCVIEFSSSSNVTFVSNTGYDGGAIAIMGFSLLKINDNTSFKFISTQVSGEVVPLFTSQQVSMTLSHQEVASSDIQGKKALYEKGIFQSTLIVIKHSMVRQCLRLQYFHAGRVVLIQSEIQT